jgi:hypothetical protein
MTNKTFIKITNGDIYHEMQEFHRKNDEQHIQIIQRLDKTNGGVKLGKWLGTTALMVALLAIGWFISHLNK